MKPHQLLTLDNVLPHLRKARITKHSFPRKAIACCPAHDDNHPSLGLSEAPDGKLLWKCHAGCSQEAVYEKLKELVGIKPATAKLILPSKKRFSNKQSASAEPTAPAEPLTLEMLAEDKRIPAEKLTDWYFREVPDDETGKKIAIHYLTREKSVAKIQHRFGKNAKNRFKWGSGGEFILYGLWRISEWDTTDMVYLVEGTSDCITLWNVDLPALGIPSATIWNPDWWKELEEFQYIVMIPDTDKAGGDLVKLLAETQPEQFRERVYVLRLPSDVKDVNELWKRENADPERFKQVLDSCEIVLLEDTPEYQNSRTNKSTLPEPDSDDEDGEPLFLPITELLARSPARELEYVPLLGTDGLIPRGAITMIGAHPKAGKTTLLKHACREWVKQNLRVVYLTEDPEIIWRERVKEFPELHTSTFILNNFSRVHPEHWVRELRKLEPDVVVVDTIRRFVPAKDENDSASVSVALAPLVDLQHHLPRTAIVLVHHTKKNLSTDGEITDIAGSHAYTAEVDAIFLLAPVRENKYQRILTPVAGRFWKFTPEPLVLELSESGTEYRVLGTVAEVLPLTQAQNAKQKVLNAMKVLGKATADEIAEYLRAGGEFVASSHLRNMLAELVHDGKLLRSGDGKRGNPYIYSIPPDPNDTPSVSSDVPIPQETEQQNDKPDGEPNLFTLPTDTVNKQSCNQATAQPHDSENNTPRNGISRISRITIHDEPLQQFTMENNPPTAVVYEPPQPETTVDELLRALAIPELDNQPTQHNPATVAGVLSNSTHNTDGGIEMMKRTNCNSTVDSDTLFRTALKAGFPQLRLLNHGNRLDIAGSYAGWKSALPTLAKENVLREAYLALNRCASRKETHPIAGKITNDGFTFSTCWRVEVVSIEWIDDGERLKWVFRTVDDGKTLTATTKYSTKPDSKFVRWVCLLTKEPNS